MNTKKHFISNKTSFGYLTINFIFHGLYFNQQYMEISYHYQNQRKGFSLEKYKE